MAEVLRLKAQGRRIEDAVRLIMAQSCTGWSWPNVDKIGTIYKYVCAYLCPIPWSFHITGFIPGLAPTYGYSPD